jgi:hypothetical protein
MSETTLVSRGGLSPEEQRLIARLREIPPGPVGQELTSFIEDLIEFVLDPRCPEAQADGVPCISLALACEQCQMVISELAGLHRRLRRA